MNVRLHAGTYARNGGGGLHYLESSGRSNWSIRDTFPGAQNASFGTHSSRHDVYYFIDEQAEGALGAYRKTSSGWEQLARVRTLGAEPCYVTLDADQSSLAVANYGSGSAAVFRLDEGTGIPLEPPIVLQNAGSGPDQDRQDGPHAHCTCFSRDKRWLFVVDLGTDEVLAYAFDPADSSLGERKTAFSAPPGSGPRHLVYHPILPLALLVSELDSTLTVLQCTHGRLLARQTVSALPASFVDESLAGHLSVNAAGDRVYVTNRGHDSIAVFAWDEAGVLELLQHVPSGGASPRSFVLLEAERQLLIANEEEGNITTFALEPDGTLSQLVNPIPLPGAVFLMVASHNDASDPPKRRFENA
jgi:6-phosphogluconolactonase